MFSYLLNSVLARASLILQPPDSSLQINNNAFINVQHQFSSTVPCPWNKSCYLYSRPIKTQDNGPWQSQSQTIFVLLTSKIYLILSLFNFREIFWWFNIKVLPFSLEMLGIQALQILFNKSLRKEKKPWILKTW